MAHTAHAWYARPAYDILAELGSTEAGLSRAEAARRLGEYGPNALPEPKVPGMAAIFFSQFASPLIYILLGAAAVVLLMGEVVDAIIILAVLLFNSLIGAVQEGKAQSALAALKRFAETSATVLRDGTAVIVRDTEVVPGDVILLAEGEKVPADARLIAAHSLALDEASLTGESAPVEKTRDALPRKSIPLADRRNMAFKGTNVVRGEGAAVVVATGIRTELGTISAEIASIDTEMPLKASVRRLSRIIIATVAVLGAFLMVVGIAKGFPLRTMFATVVSLAVSVIPEGLPVVLTLVLVTGVWRMAKQNVLVKKLQAVEALGQAKVIAVDKTGTLTRNEMLIEKAFVGGKLFTVEGSGYEPQGRILLGDMPVEPLNHPELVLAGRIAAFCANARLMYVEDTGAWKVSGDPTEAALKVFAEKVGFRDGEEEAARQGEFPFDHATKYHLTIHRLDKKNFLTAVGAPERILALSRSVWSKRQLLPLTKKRRDELEETFLTMSREGLRVVGLAMHTNAPRTAAPEHLPPLTFVGFFGMKDPLREGVREAVQAAASAGMRVVMITGDHKLTAHAIAKEAGIADHEDGIITGEELDALPDSALAERLAATSIFARVTPHHKLRIIGLFRRRGEIIAMTGDGVNDAPSLAAADLGVAMGKIGTEVAKEAADVVLLDDNFKNIIAAAEEGRSIYATIKKVILYLFSTSLGEALSITGAILIGLPLPVLPAQIIWLNFVTDGFLVVALAMEPKERGLLGNGFRKPRRFLVDAPLLRGTAYMGTVIAAGTLFIFSYYLTADPAKALTVSLTVLAVFQWFNAWNCRNDRQSVFHGNMFENLFLFGATILVITLQLLAIYHPFFQKVLHTVPLELSDWLLLVPLAASILIIEEIRKYIVRIWTR